MLPMSTPALPGPPTVKLSGVATHAVNLPLAGCSEWRVASTSFTHLAEDARRRSPAGEGWFTGTMEEGRAQPPLAPPRRVGKGYLSEPSLLILVIRCAPEVFCHAEFSCSATLIYCAEHWQGSHGFQCERAPPSTSRTEHTKLRSLMSLSQNHRFSGRAAYTHMTVDTIAHNTSEVIHTENKRAKETELMASIHAPSRCITGGRLHWPERGRSTRRHTVQKPPSECVA